MDAKHKKKHTVLMNGPISSTFIGDAISKHSIKTNIGAHAIFLGQIRMDKKKDSLVCAIEYSAHPEMAEKAFENIREKAFEKYEMECMHIYHSIGNVKVGEISLFVFVSCKHRIQSFLALEWIVESIKKEVPIWKKEILSDGGHNWINEEISTTNG